MPPDQLINGRLLAIPPPVITERENQSQSSHHQHLGLVKVEARLETPPTAA